MIPVVMASGWEYEGPVFELQRLMATFDSGLPIKLTYHSQPNSVPLMNKNLQGVLKHYNRKIIDGQKYQCLSE